LLTLAEKEFDVFITVDRKISTQQDLTKFKIPVLLLRSRTNRLEDIRPLVPEIRKTVVSLVARERWQRRNESRGDSPRT
jgi:hypothetical protein